MIEENCLCACAACPGTCDGPCVCKDFRELVIRDLVKRSEDILKIANKAIKMIECDHRQSVPAYHERARKLGALISEFKKFG